jgi:hypothetical protein
MELNITDKNALNAIISSFFVLDCAKKYMAVLRNLDPSPTPTIDILKGKSQRILNHTGGLSV